MKTFALLIAAATLTACAAAPVFRNASGDEASQSTLLACDYEATKATAGIASMMEQAIMHARINAQCLAMQGYRATR